MRAKEQADKLATFLSTSNDSEIQMMAVDALVTMKAKEQANKLATFLSTSNNSRVQEALAEALGTIGAKEQADTGDHNVSDRFVQLLRIRKAKSQ